MKSDVDIGLQESKTKYSDVDSKYLQLKANYEAYMNNMSQACGYTL
jgi:hypothetical protein